MCHNRTLTAALDGCTPYEMVYGMKPDVADLRAFSAPCAIVKLKEKLNRLDDWAKMCVFIGYKYGGGGYRVWDLRVPGVPGVVETRDMTFFEEGLPSPTYHDLATRLTDDLGPLPQQLDFAPDKSLSMPAQLSESAHP